MRQAQGGGLTDERRESREGIRLIAAERVCRGQGQLRDREGTWGSVCGRCSGAAVMAKGGQRALGLAGSASPL